ncbi:hypothetical protein H310_14280 [Aphanomyces invadans]|uniref:Uncharacterized protein n=1 Tax=Aphanomyces invadans TaxID=157072 RepID=A0A024TA64_9STRA|nr:hypothetical protein H310_14280 [Aphanomyces invadans]ETV91040.1 hypothetical protein H310_14280 [Aphanomyces invadans]|eukprot:XP_008880320.1 hypothetical protein H310_14280 [Aphanomyces invadans]
MSSNDKRPVVADAAVSTDRPTHFRRARHRHTTTILRPKTLSFATELAANETPRAVAVAECVPTLSSYNATSRQCVAPVPAVCQKLTTTQGCVLPKL